MGDGKKRKEAKGLINFCVIIVDGIDFRPSPLDSDIAQPPPVPITSTVAIADAYDHQ